MSFQASHSGNMVVTHLTEGGERMHRTSSVAYPLGLLTGGCAWLRKGQR
ncbi:MAG: hypothetical protein QOE30_4493, partial [Mycobacterium sp.]|nr:hypothetical protein [Mycobacterium sp.]